MQEFTIEEVASYNGKNGAKAYVIYKGKVYDVTDSDLWADGEHMGLHEAGSDLTDALEAEAPHESSNLDTYAVVGTIKK